MIFVAVAVLLTGALFGFYMFARHLKRHAIPAWSAVLHGAFGATGFAIVLLLMATRPELGLLRVVLSILIGAIVLGVVNLLFHVRRVRHRSMLIVMHALTAVAGVGTLAYAGLVAASSPPSPPAPVVPPEPAKPGPSVAMAAAIGTPAPASSPTSAPTTTAPKPAFPTGPAWTDHPLVFANASAALDARAQRDLGDVAAELRSHPEITLVEIQGHTDERGDATTNDRLARARATAVTAFLASKGVASSRLRAASYGGTCPADASCEGPSAPSSCHEASSLAQDRRVTLLILESSGARFHGKVMCDAGMRLAPREDDRYASE